MHAGQKLFKEGVRLAEQRMPDRDAAPMRNTSAVKPLPPPADPPTGLTVRPFIMIVATYCHTTYALLRI